MRTSVKYRVIISIHLFLGTYIEVYVYEYVFSIFIYIYILNFWNSPNDSLLPYFPFSSLQLLSLRALLQVSITTPSGEVKTQECLTGADIVVQALTRCQPGGQTAKVCGKCCFFFCGGRWVVLVIVKTCTSISINYNVLYIYLILP